MATKETKKRITFDQEYTKTDHGRRLYAYWRRIKHWTDSPEFLDYLRFYKWAMDNGYTVGAKLFREDENEKFSPDNCFWVAREDWVGVSHASYMDEVAIRKWDETINRIREHYGMEPIHSFDGEVYGRVQTE
jgi:hypothetical protein